MRNRDYIVYWIFHHYLYVSSLEQFCECSLSILSLMKSIKGLYLLVVINKVVYFSFLFHIWAYVEAISKSFLPNFCSSVILSNSGENVLLNSRNVIAIRRIGISERLISCCQIYRAGPLTTTRERLSSGTRTQNYKIKTCIRKEKSSWIL